MKAEEILKEIQALPEKERKSLLSLIKSNSREDSFSAALDEVMQKYESSLRELAR